MNKRRSITRGNYAPSSHSHNGLAFHLAVRSVSSPYPLPFGNEANRLVGRAHRASRNSQPPYNSSAAWRQPASLLFLAIASLLITTGCGRRQEEAQLPVRPVITTIVEEPVSGRTRVFAGVTRGEVETPISFRVGGEIAELAVQSGDTVEEGQLIARLDTIDLELNVRRLEAQLALAESQVRQAAAEFERVQALFEANTASRSEFDRARAARDSAEAQRDTAQEGLNQARTQFQHGTRHAPRAGTIISVPANVYQFVGPGQPVAILRADLGIVLEITVAEILAGDLSIGQSARVTLEAFPGEEFEGEISEIGAGLTGLAAFPVNIRITNPPSAIRSGQAGEARIVFDGGLSGVVVPLAAVTGATDDQRFAWVVDTETETVHRRPVEVGALVGDQLEIRSGLESGDVIVTRGANRLTDGQRVRLLP